MSAAAVPTWYAEQEIADVDPRRRVAGAVHAVRDLLQPVSVGCNSLSISALFRLRFSSGGRRAAAMYTLVETAKLNDINPQAWLTDLLARLPGHPAKRVPELLPWNRHLRPP